MPQTVQSVRQKLSGPQTKKAGALTRPLFFKPTQTRTVTIQTSENPQKSSRNQALLNSQQQEELEELQYIAALTLIKNQKQQNQAFAKNSTKKNFKQTDILQGLNPIRLLPEHERDLIVQAGKLIK